MAEFLRYIHLDGIVHQQERRHEATSRGGQRTSEVPPASPREGALGIQVQEGPDTALKFNHSPLTACEFLHKKFCNNSAAPEEVNLSFMLLGVTIDPS